MYLLIIILKKSEFMAAQRARPILLNERFLVLLYAPARTHPLRKYAYLLIGERAKRASLSLIIYFFNGGVKNILLYKKIK